MNSPAGELAAAVEAAEPFVADRGERRRLDPERLEARRRPWRRHCRAGASATGRGSAARRAASRDCDSRSPTKSGSSTSSGVLAGQLEDRAVKLDHAHHLRAADLIGLAAMGLRLERGHGDRLAEVADIDRLEACAWRRSPEGTAAAPSPAKRLVSSSSGPNTSDGRTIVALGKPCGPPPRPRPWCGRKRTATAGRRRSRRRGPAPPRRHRAPPRRRCARRRRGRPRILPPKTPHRLTTARGALDRRARRCRALVMSACDEAELADLAERLDEIGVARIARGDADPDARS